MKEKSKYIGIVGTGYYVPDGILTKACLVQKNIGATQSVAFDISAACSGFIYGLSIARQFLQNGTYETALVIGTEVFSRIVDWQDRNTCVLFGDGAGAAVLRKLKNGSGILSIHLGADGTGADFLKQPAGGSRLPASHETVNRRLHYIKMNGKEVYKFATRSIVKAVNNGLDKIGLSSRDINLLIPHQTPRIGCIWNWLYHGSSCLGYHSTRLTN